ncbi:MULTISPECIES: MarR family transcriptional regulator [unclassified Paenibacillus]|uniref:MarR family winged helix-turn-helix transcriptional regulator n=1 Tax=unclassified Paenibacillus TaxID=185978 RepID=UPI0009569EC9|nr:MULTISPECIES: MarR family transcriptional regulator [unclassified Paenibacillus]ASS67538.1 MarR family transcriptional regulator [Paenibacillus sp. RUD330]SIQ73504.1 DNA-binding transcriptional regulator, MarR family [Paenibacillus sp. RU4X]SIQ94923.1 DNA-binding transcriptional regulator, MarR family [Paenibacillus sp. RU4T]
MHPDESQSGLSAVDSLVQLSFLVQSILGRAGAEHDLSVIQIRLLGILRDREPSMQQLSRHLDLDKSSITGLVDRAERRGLVERTVAPADRRGFNVRMTSTGRELVRSVGGEIELRLQAALDVLPDDERSRLASLAAKLLGASARLQD